MSQKGTTTYGYNLFNRQSKVEMADGQTLESLYDGEGLRAGTVQNGKASTFFYYNGELLGEEQSNRMILGYGVAASEVSGKAGYHAYHSDEQLSTGYITNAEQGVENRYTYNAFGEVREKEENIHNRILYTGQQYDQVTGQYYLRARFYNPVVGRFLQEDEYRGDGLNLYAYCGNNPVVYYDPSGYGKREDYLGGTLKMNSPGGRQVLDAMMKEGKINISGITNPKIKKAIESGDFFSKKIKITSDLKNEIEFQSEKGGWFPLSQANMSHKNTNGHKDAVDAWNQDLKKYGPKSPEAREYMKNPDNYYLETESKNKSDGANLRKTYDDPPVKSSEDEVKSDKCPGN